MDTTILKLIEGPRTEMGTQTAQCVMSISQLAMLYKVHIYKRSDGRVSKDAGYQRAAEEKRIEKLTSSLAGDLTVVNAVILNYREAKKDIDFDSSGYKNLKVSTKDALWAVDGQHRCEAWIKLYEEAENYGLSQKEVGERKINATLYLGASIQEEVYAFYNINHFGKGIKLENRMELNVFLAKQNFNTFDQSKNITLVDNIAEKLHDDEIFNGKIRFANEKTGIAPKSSLIISIQEIYKDENFTEYSEQGMTDLLLAVWRAVQMVYPEIIGKDSVPKDWSLQKALGITIVHRLVPIIKSQMMREDAPKELKDRREETDPLVWKPYFERMREELKDINDEGVGVNGLEFWRAGSKGAAGKYSSAKGRASLLEMLRPIVKGQ